MGTRSVRLGKRSFYTGTMRQQPKIRFASFPFRLVSWSVRCPSPYVMKVQLTVQLRVLRQDNIHSNPKHTYNYYEKASSNFATCQLPTSIRHAHSTRKSAPSNISTTISVCELHPGLRLQKDPFPFCTQPDCRPLNPKLLKLLNTSVMTKNMTWRDATPSPTPTQKHGRRECCDELPLQDEHKILVVNSQKRSQGKHRTW